MCLLGLAAGPLAAQETSPADPVEPPTKSLFRDAEDGLFDLSNFLDTKYGFLPLPVPITEPAVGYGLALGLAFIDQPLGGGGESGMEPPNISLVGGFGTENGSGGVFAGDLRHWRDNRLQSFAAYFDSSVNLDYYGIGDAGSSSAPPLPYTLDLQGGVVRGKHRLGATPAWLGMSYAWIDTAVRFDTAGPGIPEFEADSTVAGFVPIFSFDSRNNFFTPLSGNYLELATGFFDEAFGSSTDFQRVNLLGMHFRPLAPRWFLGLRGELVATHGDTPFYAQPFITLRGVPMMRYLGERLAQAETELRWQAWRRFSLVGFAGAGRVSNEVGQQDISESVLSGGAGFRYEIARRYGLHMGLDLGFSEADTAIYLVVGSAWARP